MAVMDGMTKEEVEEYQERLSKLYPGTPEMLALPTRQRIQLLAALITDKIIEDQRNGAPLLRKIKREAAQAKKD